MGLPQQIGAIYQTVVGSGNVKIQSWPNAAVGIKVTSGAKVFSAWTALLVAAKIANPCWLVGAHIENPADAGANETWVVDLATGAAGSEVSISSGTNTAQGFDRIDEFWLSSVGMAMVNSLLLPIPIKVVGSPAISGAVAGLLVGSKAVYMSFQTATGLGT